MFGGEFDFVSLIKMIEGDDDTTNPLGSEDHRGKVLVVV